MLKACFPSEFVVTGYAYSLKEPPMILMEYMKEGSLEGFIKAEKKSSLNFLQRIQIAIDIASGLNHLRSKRIVHRDIKPENVLIYQTKPGVFRAKICDFGFAKEITDKLIDAEACQGSVKYNAVDEVLYFGKDIYSFGILLFDLFVAEQTAEIVFPKSDTYPRLLMRTFQGEVRESLEEVCRKMELDAIFKPIAELILLCTDRNHEKRPAPDKIIASLNVLLQKKEWHHSIGVFSISKATTNNEQKEFYAKTSPNEKLNSWNASSPSSVAKKNIFVGVSAPDEKPDLNSDEDPRQSSIMLILK